MDDDGGGAPSHRPSKKAKDGPRKLSAATAAAKAATTPLPAAAGIAALGSGDVSAMSLRELKQLLGARGVDYSKCIEKSEIRALAIKATANDEECAICLDVLQQPQTMPCGHRFCRGCVASMRQHGGTEVQLCPLCRGAMPDVDRVHLEAVLLVVQFDQRHESQCKGASQRPHMQAAYALSTEAMRVLLRSAMALLQECLTIEPEHASALSLLGDVLTKSGDTDGAIVQYRHALAADPHCFLANPARYNLGMLLAQRGDIAGAEAAFRAAIVADPQDAGAHYNLGVLLDQRGNIVSAKAAYRAATAADPQDIRARHNLGCLLNRCGEHSGAEAAFRAVLAIDPQHAESHFQLGCCLKGRGEGPFGEYAGAKAAFRAVLAIDHTLQADAHTELGVLVAMGGLDHGVRTGPDNVAGARHFAAALKINPSHVKAKAGLQMAIKFIRINKSGMAAPAAATANTMAAAAACGLSVSQYLTKYF